MQSRATDSFNSLPQDVYIPTLAAAFLLDHKVQIVTDKSGIVPDCEIIFKPTSEYMRRIRCKSYKQPLRVELPEDNRSNAMQTADAWL